MSDCIIFSGLKDSQGYGVLSIGNKRLRAHRVAFKIANPSITLTKNYLVCHKCDNPSCINPNHLFRGKEADNHRDQVSKNRQVRGSKHGRSKLTEKDVKQIRYLFSKIGLSHIELSRRFKVSPRTIRFIIDKVNWSHL